MKMRHHHGGSDPLSRNIAQREEHRTVGQRDHVAIVAAHRPDRFVVIANFPLRESEVGTGKQLALKPPGEVQVLFERSLLLRGQVVKAVAQERIDEQAPFLDRVVADNAKAVGPPAHPAQRIINLLEKVNKRRRVMRLRDGGLQTFTPVAELLFQNNLGLSIHV